MAASQPTRSKEIRAKLAESMKKSVVAKETGLNEQDGLASKDTTSAKPETERAEGPYFSFQSFMELFGQTKIYILFVCAVVGVAVFLSVRQDRRISADFTSSAEIQILPGNLQLDFARNTLGGTRDAQIASIVRSFSEELMSDEVLERAVPIALGDNALWRQNVSGKNGGNLSGFFDWLNYGPLPKTEVDPFEYYRDAIDISSINGSFVMRISATLPDAQRAADLANTIISVYSEIEQENLDNAKFALRAAYSEKLEEAEAELRALIDRELELNGTLAVEVNGQGSLIAPPLEAVAELRSNLQSQEALVRAIASLRTEFVNSGVTANGLGPQAVVLRKARPAQLPDGTTPLVKGLAAAVGLFVFLIGSLVVATTASAFFKKAASKKVRVFR